MNVVVNVDANRRLRVYPQGGCDMEARVEGIGWVLDNDAAVSDCVLQSYLDNAAAVLQLASSKLPAVCTEFTHPRERCLCSACDGRRYEEEPMDPALDIETTMEEHDANNADLR